VLHFIDVKNENPRFANKVNNAVMTFQAIATSGPLMFQGELRNLIVQLESRNCDDSMPEGQRGNISVSISFLAFARVFSNSNSLSPLKVTNMWSKRSVEDITI